MRTKFVYDAKSNPIGRVDEEGNIYTLNGNLSYPHYQGKGGVAVNKSHQSREKHVARMFKNGLLEWDEIEDEV